MKKIKHPANVARNASKHPRSMFLSPANILISVGVNCMPAVGQSQENACCRTHLVAVASIPFCFSCSEAVLLELVGKI